MEKPVKQIKESYNLFDIESYICDKYNCGEDFEKTWDYMCDNLGAGNYTYSYIPVLNNAFTNAVKEEFGQEVNVWISW